LSVDAVVLLATVMPAIDVVISDDVEFIQEGRRCGFWVGGDLIAGGRNGSSRILAADDVDKALQGCGTVVGGLVGNLIASTPENDGWVVAVSLEHGEEVALRPLVEVSVVAVYGCLPL
jgi:hypothetical protein